jgi:short-subunit dehydrogenase
MGAALISGASAGLGVEFAHQLASKGLDLILVARRMDKLNEVRQALSQQYPTVRIELIEGDLSKPETPAHITQTVTELGLDLHYLINNAGASGPRLLHDQSLGWQVHQDYLTLMMTSITELCHRLMPAMMQAGYGRVINVASVAGRIASGGDSHYGPTKAYVIALSEALALTVKDHGVNVSALCPGFTHTDFHETAGLSEMKRSTPSFLWYDAKTVVREGLQGVEKGKPIVVSGRLYRWLDPLMQSVWSRWIFKRGESASSYNG